MTAPVTGLVIDIADDGTVHLSAADWLAEGHLWSIPRRQISIARLLDVAAILGPDAVSGVEARLLALRQRLAGRVETRIAALAALDEAERALRTLNDALEGTPLEERG